MTAATPFRTGAQLLRTFVSVPGVGGHVPVSSSRMPEARSQSPQGATRSQKQAPDTEDIGYWQIELKKRAVRTIPSIPGGRLFSSVDISRCNVTVADDVRPSSRNLTIVKITELLMTPLPVQVAFSETPLKITFFQ